jgi:M6 family metalloprotease-like protein
MKKITLILLLASALNGALAQKSQKEIPFPPGPVDPQMVQDQDDMTWDDYHPIPGKNWADPALVPQRKFRMALVAVDFPDQPFVITQSKGSDLFGNPQISPVLRKDVPQFYADFWLKPSPVNHGQTINGYWMEQSGGRFGITHLDAFGPYRMPGNLWSYGLNEYGQNNSTPDGSRAVYWMEHDIDSLWKADAGDTIKSYDAVLRIYAGYDETGVWQEFGEMKFRSKDDIPAEWGNPNPELPRWIPTRYVPWTSWKAGQMQWGLSSIRQGENSGTITHEIGHYAFDIGDNNNNPYVKPYRRVGSGPWDMMDRGCFNGPGGPHKRWVVPAIMGASMPAGLMLRNKILNKFVPKNEVLTLSREGLSKSGPVIARVAARAAEPPAGTLAGIVIRLDGAEPHDRTPAGDPSKNPLSPGIPNFDFYSVEVVQRIGYDSFCPDNGVLIAMNKDKESRNGGQNGFNCFNWVIDAHPEDINMVDYIKPDGTKVMRTIADYRQLNDALFHAGTGSGSKAEWIDTPNRLHFYILDAEKNTDGILIYRIGIKSPDGPDSGEKIEAIVPSLVKLKSSMECIPVIVRDTNQKLAGTDIWRVTATVTGSGWEVSLPYNFMATSNGNDQKADIYVRHDEKHSKMAEISLNFVSESNPAKVISSRFNVK